MNKYYIGIDQNGWYIKNKVDGNKIYESNDRINNLINNINKSKIERAFLYKNLKDLGVKYYLTDIQYSESEKNKFNLTIKYENVEKKQYIYQVD